MSHRFTLRQLEYFDAVASEGSISAAAVKCHVTATALALALDELEANLGLQLVVRQRGKGVTLTPAGAGLLRHAQSLLSGAETFAEEASQNASGLKGRLVIGCFPTLTPFFLPAAMERFSKHHSGLTLEFEEAPTSILLDALVGGRVDAAIMYGVDVSKQLEFEPVSQHRPYAIVASDHRLAGRKKVSLTELAAEPLIQLDMRPSQQNTANLFTAHDLKPSLQYTTTNYEFARSLVGRGLGYSILIQRPATLRTYDGHDVTILEISNKLSPTIVGLARPKGAPRTMKFRALKEFLVSHAQTALANAAI